MHFIIKYRFSSYWDLKYTCLIIMLVVQYERRDSVYKKRGKTGQVRDGEREASLILSSCVGSCVCVCVLLNSI